MHISDHKVRMEDNCISLLAGIVHFVIIFKVMRKKRLHRLSRMASTEEGCMIHRPKKEVMGFLVHCGGLSVRFVIVGTRY